MSARRRSTCSRRRWRSSPATAATLQALIDLYTDAGDCEAVIKQKRALIGVAGDARDEKFTLSEEIAGIYKEKLNNPQKAIAAYLEALEPQAGRSPAAAQRARPLQRDQAVEEGDGDPDEAGRARDSGKGKARFLVAAGNIANYELHSTDEAVELYNQALDEDPDDLKAFERIDKIMTAKKDWKNQERNYRKMIKRLGQEPAPEQASRRWSRCGTRWARSTARASRTSSRRPRPSRSACSSIRTRRRATRSSPSSTSWRARRPTSKAVKEYRHLIKATHRLRPDGRAT